jgi:hypothetical protein
MTRLRPWFGRLTVALTTVGLTPSLAAGQLTDRLSVPLPTAARSLDTEAAACALTDEARGVVWMRVMESRRLDPGAASSVLDALEDSLAVEAAARPADLGVQYDLALVMGARAELQDGTELVRAAEALDRQAHAVLALDPYHAGAQHLLGRLHASVLRMNGVKRFVATRILGGDRLAGASWDDVRTWFEWAAEKDPCVPDHHYELAHFYYEQEEPRLAWRQLDRLATVTAGRELYSDILEKGEALAARLAER